MASNDIYVCKLELTTWDVNHSISFHVRDDSGATEGNGAIQLAQDLNTWLTTLFANVLAADTILEAWYALRVNTPENPGLKQLDDEHGAFPGGSESYPPNSCAVFSFRGEDPLLVRAGRFYLGGLPKNAVEGGKLDPVWLVAAQLLADTLEGGVGGYGIGVYRTVDAGVPIPGGLFVPIDEIVIDPVVYSQRRRTSDSRGMSA